MKTCPQCQSVFPEDYVFCMNDGTTLKENETEQETVIRPKISIGQTTALSPDMLVACASCGLSNRANSKFCKKCGNILTAQNFPAENPSIGFPKFTPNLPNIKPGVSAGFQVNLDENHSSAQNETVILQTPKFTPPNDTGQYQNYAQKKSRQNIFLIVGGLLAAAIIGGIVWFANQPHPLEAKLDRAVKNNQLIKPAGGNALEYYQQLKTDGVEPKILRKYEDKVFPLLSEQTEEIFKSVTEIAGGETPLSEWQDSAKMLEWANEIRPSDSVIAAKAEYAKGRINYLTDQKSAAIENWKKAADLDKKWAIPLNGIGLIYNEQKSYEEARKWLMQAVEREPNWAIPYNNLGSSYFFQNRFDEAEAYYLKAVELEPRWARPHAWLGSIAMKRYNCNEAVAYFEKVLAPDAVSAAEMNLESIRRQREKAKSCSFDYNSQTIR